MCERFTLRASAKGSMPHHTGGLAIRTTADGNGAGSNRRETVRLHWGLNPSWAKDPKIGNSLINARAETVATRPAFRSHSSNNGVGWLQTAS